MPATRRRHPLRRVVFIVLAAVGAILALVAAGWFPQEPVRAFVEKQLRAAMGPGSRVGSLHVVPGTLSVELRDLVVNGPAYHVEVPRLAARGTLALVLGRSLTLASVDAESPRIRLQPPPQAPTAPQQQSAQKPIVIRSLRVSGATITYGGSSLPGDVVLRDIEIHGGLGAGALDIASSGGVWQRPQPFALGPTRGRLRLSPRLDVAIESLESGTTASRISVSGSLGNAAEPKLDLDLRAALDLRDAAALEPGTPLAGRIDVTAHVSGTAEAPSARADVRATAVEVEGVHAEHGDAHLEYAGGARPTGRAQWNVALLGGSVEGDARIEGTTVDARLRADRLETQSLPGRPVPVTGTFGATARAQGPLDGRIAVSLDAHASGRDSTGDTHALEAHASGTLAARATAVDLHWRAVLDTAGPATAGAAAPQGVTTARMTLTGDARGAMPPTVDASLSGRVLLRASGQLLEVPVDGTLRSGAAGAVAAHVRAALLNGTIEADAAAHGAALDALTVDAAGIDLSRLGMPARGTMGAHVRASGAFDRLDASGVLEARDVAWRDVALGTTTVSLDMKDGRGGLTLAAPALHVHGRGRLSPGRDARLEATIAIDGLPLATFASLVPPERQPLDGQVAGQIEIGVPFAHPDRATVTARIDDARVTSKDLSLHTAQAFVIEAKGRAVTLHDVHIEGGPGSLRVSGSVGMDGARPIALTLNATSDLAKLPLPQPWTAAGTLDADVRVSGTVAAPRATGTLGLRGLRLADARGSPLVQADEIRVALEGDQATLAPVEAAIAGGHATVEGTLPLAVLGTTGGASSGGPARVRATWRELQLARLMAAAPASEGAPPEAALSGTLDLRAARASLPALAGTISIEETHARVEDQEIVVSPVTATIENGRLSASQIVVRSAGTTLTTSLRGDLRTRAVDVRSDGDVDLRALSPFVGTAALAGHAELHVAVTGTADAPQARGAVAVTGATVRMRDIPDSIQDLEGRVVLEGSSLRLDGVTATVGGGRVTLGGGARIAKASLADMRFTAKAEELALRYPVGFKSRVRGDIAVSGDLSAMTVSGEVVMERGLYDQDIFLDQALSAPAVPPATEQQEAMLARVALNLSARTEQSVRVKNNLADLRAGGHLDLRGSLQSPAPFGRLEIADGGKIFMQTRTFTITSGNIIYNGSLTPDVDIHAESLISEGPSDDVQVTIAVSGPLMKPDLKLTSDPSYSEREIASLIATGRRNVGLDSSAWVVGEQTAALLAGRLTRNVSKALMGLGLDEVDIQPELLAREADPGARFTFGKSLTPQLKLVYSTGLNDPEARFFQAQYRFRLGRELTAKIQRDDTGVYSYGLGQKLRFGGPPRRRRHPGDETRTLTDVRVAGAAPLPEETVRRTLGAKVGQKVTFWDLQDDADRLQKKLVQASYMEAMVTARLEGDTAVFQIAPGAAYRWQVTGMDAPPNLTKPLSQAIFEEDALDRGRKALLDAARSRGYLRARVDTDTEADERGRTLVFKVDPGPEIRSAEVEFPGAKALSRKALLSAAGGPGPLLTTPKDAIEAMKTAYQRAHYLTAVVSPPRVVESEDRSRVRITVPVHEGPPAKVVAVRFEGTSQPQEGLRNVARLDTGLTYDPQKASEAVQRVREHFFKLGFPDVRVTPEVTPHGPDVDVTYRIVEGDPVTVGDVVVNGLGRTRLSLVRREVDDVLKRGAPLDPRQLPVVERRLLNLGVFSRVVVSAAGDPATITVDVEEQGPYSVTYDARFSPEERATGLVDGEVGNLGGLGMALGARYRRGSQLRETRGSFHVPMPHTGDVTLSLFQQIQDFTIVDELTGATGPVGEPLFDRETQTGFDLQQARHLASRWDLLYGYRFKRLSSPALGFRERLSGVEASLIRDTRDNPLNAKRGRFWSLSLELSPKILGSSVDLYRFFGQTFLTHSFNPSLSFAQGYRLGFAQGLGNEKVQELQLFGNASELFRAGGGASLRGYATDSVGPLGSIPGLSAGGEATIVVNEELRYFHPTGLGAALFYDVGNVFARVKDVGFDLRHDVGFGFRYESPVGLLRLDFGFPLNRRPGDRSYQFFFSLGQAF